MKKDITELPSDVQVQIRGLEALPDDQRLTRLMPWRFLTGPMPGVESSIGL